jgi:hypothetical protein
VHTQGLRAVLSYGVKFLDRVYNWNVRSTSVQVAHEDDCPVLSDAGRHPCQVDTT